MMQEQQLASLLNQETSSLQQLQNILQLEYDALMGTDIGAIERATSNKNQALENQAEATRSRKNFIAQSGADETEEGIQQLIASYSNCDELASAYSNMLSLARQCHETNRANGRLITEKQHQARMALNIIRQTDNHLPTYSGQGKAMDAPTTRSLGKV